MRQFDIAAYLQRLPDGVHKYMLAAEGSGGTDIVRFLTYGRIKNLHFLQPVISFQKPMVVIVADTGEISSRVRTLFPEGRIQMVDLHPGKGTEFAALIVE